MTNHSINNLLKINILLNNISNESYQMPCETIFCSTIGQHIRHVLEFYLCLFNGVKSGNVSYDCRQRRLKLENSTEFASETIMTIIDNLKTIDKNTDISVKANFSTNEQDEILIKSSLFRELAFCMDHSIHHMALIKTGLKELNCLDLIDKNFGIAPSTLRHQKQCAQ